MGGRSTKVQAGEPQIGINQHFPDGVVYEAHPVDADVELNDLLRGVEVDLRALLKGKTTIILGVPGAYTPNCTQYHLPGYIDKFDAFKLAGADQIICLSANDVFVARSWAQALGAEGKVRVLADPSAKLARAAGLALDLQDTLGRTVYKRFSAIVEDGVVRLLFVESDGLGLQCSLAVPLLSEFISKKYRRMHQ